MTHRSTIWRRVKRGAAWLDEVYPTWWSYARLDLAALDLSSRDRCVLGQIVKPYDARADYWSVVVVEGPCMLTLNPSENVPETMYMNHEAAVSRGFHLGTCESGVTWHALTETWRRLVLNRRKAAGIAA